MFTTEELLSDPTLKEAADLCDWLGSAEPKLAYLFADVIADESDNPQHTIAAFIRGLKEKVGSKNHDYRPL